MKHKILIESAYLEDFYHNKLGTLNVCIQGRLLDEEGINKTANGGKVLLTIDCKQFRCSPDKDILVEARHLADAYNMMSGQVKNLEQIPYGQMLESN